MADDVSKIANCVLTSESALWMQKDAVCLKGSTNPAKPNPFVQAQASASQTPSKPSAPAGNQQKQP